MTRMISPGSSLARFVARRLFMVAPAVLVGAMLIGTMPVAQAQTGMSAAEATPIGEDGTFMGTTVRRRARGSNSRTLVVIRRSRPT